MTVSVKPAGQTVKKLRALLECGCKKTGYAGGEVAQGNLKVIDCLADFDVKFHVLLGDPGDCSLLDPRFLELCGVCPRRFGNLAHGVGIRSHHGTNGDRGKERSHYLHGNSCKLVLPLVAQLLELLIGPLSVPACLIKSPADAFGVETQTNDKTVNYCRHCPLSPALAVKF